MRWYERGARLNDPECRYDLGFMYILGEGTAADPRAGVALLEQAACQGFCNAMRLLADLFSTGAHGVAADPAEAERWSRALAEHLARHPEDKRAYER
jgi:TPR repeat protein